MFEVYGDYGYENETLLGKFDKRNDAIKWADENYNDEMTEYRIVEVAFFVEGEYCPVHVIRRFEG